MPSLYEHRHLVAPQEIDELGHANNLDYLRWLQEAALAHSAVQGWPAAAYKRLGLGWVVRSHEITYERPAQEGDLVIVRTWVASFRKASSVRRYDVIRELDKKRLATAATNWAFVDYSTGLPTRIPPEIIGSFELHMEP
jgi:acyl-CoA thioester hydrolase